MTLHEHLVRELKVVRRSGLHRLRAHLDELPALERMAEHVSGSGTAEHIESLLRTVWQTRAEGAQGTAIGLLLGLEQGRRGANPTVLRQAASDRLGYHSVDTFRKAPEARAIEYFADLLEGYAIDFGQQPRRQDKVEEVLQLIRQLTVAEYGQLVARLRTQNSGERQAQ